MQTEPSKTTFTTLAVPPYFSRLHIAPNFVVDCDRPRPSAFRRFWYWALLGWKWEDVA